MPASDPWSGLAPSQVAELLESATTPRWVSEGSAIDVWLGRRTRYHEDFDIGCRVGDTRSLLTFPPLRYASPSASVGCTRSPRSVG